MELFWDLDKIQRFLVAAIKQYEHAPGWFTDWLDDLYRRLNEDWGPITLDEVGTLAFLYENGWIPESLAVNKVYKLFDRLGRDTSGIAGY